QLEQPRIAVDRDDAGAGPRPQEAAARRPGAAAEVEQTQRIPRLQQREAVRDQLELELAPGHVRLLETVPALQPPGPEVAAHRRRGAGRAAAIDSAAAKNATWASASGATAGTSQNSTPCTTPITVAPTIGNSAAGRLGIPKACTAT